MKYYDFSILKDENLKKKFQGWAIKLSIKPTYVKYSRFQEFITRVSTGVKLSFWFLIAYFRLDRWRPYQPPLLVSPEKIRCPLPMNKWPGHHKNESEIQINWENCRFWWIRGTWINQMLMKKKSQFRCEIVALQFRRGLRKYSNDSWSWEFD